VHGITMHALHWSPDYAIGLVDLLPTVPEAGVQFVLPRTGCVVIDFKKMQGGGGNATAEPGYTVIADASSGGTNTATRFFVMKKPFRVHLVSSQPLPTSDARLEVLRRIWLSYSDKERPGSLGSRASHHPVLKELIPALRARRTLNEELRLESIKAAPPPRRYRRRRADSDDDEEEKEEEEAEAEKPVVDDEDWRCRYASQGLPLHFGQLDAPATDAPPAPLLGEVDGERMWYPYVFSTHSLHVAHFVVDHFCYWHAQSGGGGGTDTDAGRTRLVPVMASTLKTRYRPWFRSRHGALVYLLWQLPRWSKTAIWMLEDDAAAASASPQYHVLPTGLHDLHDLIGQGAPQLRKAFTIDGTNAGYLATVLDQYLKRLPTAYCSRLPAYIHQSVTSSPSVVTSDEPLADFFQKQLVEHVVKKRPAAAEDSTAPSTKIARVLETARTTTTTTSGIKRYFKPVS
jgi:hypothetical protein